MVTSRRGMHWVAVVAAAVIVTTASVGVFAQGAGLPAWVNQILAAISSVQNDTDALQESINAIAAPIQSKVRTTPTVFFRAGVMDCLVTNVSSSPRTVTAEMINSGTGGVVTSLGPLVLAPGRVQGVGVASSAFTGAAFCRFTVTDATGTRADIRATLSIGNNLSDDQTRVAVSAE